MNKVRTLPEKKEEKKIEKKEKKEEKKTEKKEEKKTEKKIEKKAVADKKAKTEEKPSEPVLSKLDMLGMEGVVANYRRGRHEVNLKQAILMFPTIKTKKDANKLIGKIVVWNTSTGKEIKGVIRHAHGNTGSVRAFFKKAGLPGQAIGQKIKIIK